MAFGLVPGPGVGALNGKADCVVAGAVAGPPDSDGLAASVELSWALDGKDSADPEAGTSCGAFPGLLDVPAMYGGAVNGEFLLSKSPVSSGTGGGLEDELSTELGARSGEYTK